jgi:hypothetical protein
MVVAEGSEWDERKLCHDTSLWYPEFHQAEGSHIGSMSKLKHHPAVASWTVLKEGHGVGRN